MFTDPMPVATAPKQQHAWVSDPKTGDLYVAAEDASVGAIDPLYVVLAYAFNRGWNPKTVWTSYQPAAHWVVAARGLEHLAWSVNKERGGFAFKLERGSFEPSAKARGLAVGLQGGDPPVGKVLDSGDIFTPNANGFHNIPRLYLMAALTLELRKSASVAALVVNAEGLVLATGYKAHGEGGCEHAEVRALFSIRGQVPKRWMMISTLKPCTMCAGLIRALGGTGGEQYWARDDPSDGASYDNVKDLSLPKGTATLGSVQDAYHVRKIKLASGDSFTDQFKSRWGNREAAVAVAKRDLPQRLADAYAAWCTDVIKPGLSFKYLGGPNNGGTVSFKAVDDLNAKALGRGNIKDLVNFTPIFERKTNKKPGVVVQGTEPEAAKAVENAFLASKQYRDASKAFEQKTAESGMGIIEFIGKAEGSKALRQAARNALAAKFIKYGKSEDEARSVTGSADATGAVKASTDPRMKPLADYLFDFIRTQTGK